MQSIWVTVGPIVVINFVFLGTVFFFLATRDRWPVPPDLAGRHQSKFLNRFFHEYWYWLTTPVARFFVRIRFSPNNLTFIGFAVSCLAGWFFAYGWFGYAGWVMILGATFDLFDGKVARLTKRESRSGAFYDSVLDRFGEGAVFVGLAWYFRTSWMLPVVVWGLVAAMLVSYTRARGEGVGVVCKRGPMQRPERIAYLSVASIFQPIADTLLRSWITHPPAILVIGGLCCIALFGTYSAFYRMIYIMDALDSADRAGTDTASFSQVVSRLTTKAGRGALYEKMRYGYDRSHAPHCTCILFLVDGLDPARFSELLQRGDLPHIQRHIVEPGGYAPAVSVFPSTTGPAFAPMVTGCFPGTCNIPGARWFDRTVPPQRRFSLKRFRDYEGWGSYAIDFDLSKTVRTIFEYSRQAVNILGPVNRGAGLRRDPAFFQASSLLQRARREEETEAMERAAFQWFAHALRRHPDFVLYYFPTDDRMMRDGPEHHKALDATCHRLDRNVGDAVELLATHGIVDRTVLALVSGHGRTIARDHFDLEGFLDRRFRTCHAPASYRGWLAADAIGLCSGNAMANIYFRKGRAWSEAPSFAELAGQSIVASLLDEPAVDLLLGRAADGRVMVQSRRGRAHIHVNGGMTYDVEGSDPFGYPPLPREMTAAQALACTAATAYPDGLVQAAQLFRSARAGDLVVSAAPGWSLGAHTAGATEASTHGSLHRDHLLVPCAVNIPLAAADPSANAFARANRPVRTADILPTLCHLLGIVPTHEMDGHNLLKTS